MSVVTVVILLIGALLFTRVSGLVLRQVVRRMAERSPSEFASRWWRVASPRGVLDGSPVSEARRRQRVDSAARMLNHLLAIVVWIGVAIAVFQILNIDAEYFLSSAGFIGAGIAIGGQHKVNDYLTGLSVLFEDRYGAGDELVVDVNNRAEPVHAVVDHVGLFTTRLRDEASTLHIPNGQLIQVRNLSQEARAETLRLRVGDNPEFDLVSERSAAETVRGMAGSQNLTDVFFVGDLAAARRDDGDIEVEVKTVRPLDERSREVLVNRTQQALRGRR